MKKRAFDDQGVPTDAEIARACSETRPIYKLIAWNNGSIIDERDGLSWASVCGSLGNLDMTYAIVKRESDGVCVMRYDADGWKR